MVRTKLLLALGILSGSTALAGGSPVAGELYRSRYPVTNASQKMIQENGNGLASLYGTRNFRAVLNGVFYRGGGNNEYLKPVPRDVKNPLPDVGLQNLCQEGFSLAVYNYSTNFASAPHEIHCKDFQGNDNVLTYIQISPLFYKESDLRTLLSAILSHIRDPRLGPMYDHCWNGWHASGYVSATALRQFCGFTPSQAVDYWNLNTDNNHGSSYDELRRRLSAFVPYPDLTITEDEKAKLCPQPGSLAFQKRLATGGHSGK